MTADEIRRTQQAVLLLAASNNKISQEFEEATLRAGMYAMQCEIAAQLAELNATLRTQRGFIDRDHPHFQRDHRGDGMGEIDALSEALMQGKVTAAE